MNVISLWFWFASEVYDFNEVQPTSFFYHSILSMYRESHCQTQSHLVFLLCCLLEVLSVCISHLGLWSIFSWLLWKTSNLCLDSFFGLWMCRYPSTTCWKDHLFSNMLTLLLCQRSVDSIYGSLILGSLFCSFGLWSVWLLFLVSFSLLSVPFLCRCHTVLVPVALKLGSVSPLTCLSHLMLCWPSWVFAHVTSALACQYP